MHLQAKHSSLHHWKSDLIGVFLSKHPEKSSAFADLEEIFGDLPPMLMKSGEFSGEEDSFYLLHGNAKLGSRRIALMGIGENALTDYDVLRRGSARLIKQASLAGLKKVSVLFPSYLKLDDSLAAQAIVEGVLLGSYKFDKYQTKTKKKEKADELTIVTSAAPSVAIEAGIKAAVAICAAVQLTRDLANAPGNELPPRELAARAQEMCKRHRIRCTVLNEAKLRDLNMGGILGVAQGSNEPPCIIVMEYKPSKTTNKKPIALVGKGLTFDAGGISIKPAADMDRMKFDMAGGAAVIGIMQAASDLRLPIHLVGIVPSSENLLGSRAYKPGDVLTMYSGKTVEIINTDAEGRLILADALAYAQKYKPQSIVDFATLTGHCVVALGHHGAGMMGTDAEMKKNLSDAAERTAEKVWELPLWKEFDKQIKSHIADIKNTGGRPGGASTAAAFLRQFTGEYPWVHLDIAGTANAEDELPYTGRLSATGFGVRLMIEVLRRL